MNTHNNIFEISGVAWGNCIIFVLTFVMLLSRPAFSQNQEFRIKSFTLDDGLSQVSVNDLLEDYYGFLWIATADGLNRFDGKDFKHYKYSQTDSLTLSGNFVNKLLEDKNENIWIGTNGNGLNYYDSRQDIIKRVLLGQAKTKTESITALGIDEEENIWVGSLSSGLHRFKQSKNNTYQQQNFFPDKQVTALLLGQHKEMWVGDMDGNVYRANPTDEKSFENEVELKVDGQVRGFYLTEKYLLVGSDGGLYLYGLGDKKIHVFDFGKTDLQSAKYVTSFSKANPYQVWVGTGSGLFLIDWLQKTIVDKILYSEDTKKGLTNNTVTSILQLNDNQLFVGTANALNLIDFTEPAFENISKNKRGEHLLNDNVIFSLYKEKEDFYIGTSDGGLNLKRGDTVFYFNSDQKDPNSITGSVVRAIVKDLQNQRIWLATTRGLSMIDLKTFDPNSPKFSVFYHNPDDPNSINMNFLKDLALDKNNNLWGATFGKGIFRLEMQNPGDPKIIRYENDLRNQNSLYNDIAHCIRVDIHNNIWIGTQEGLVKLVFSDNNYNNPEFSTFTSVSGNDYPLSNSTVYDILIDAQERLWVGTRNGLNLYLGNNKFESWTEQKQFPNAIIYSIQDDEKGNLWLGTNHGIVRFDPENKSFKHYDVEDNIQSKEFDIHARFRDEAGTIYLGGIGGVTYFNPQNLEDIDHPQPLYFSDLRLKSLDLIDQPTSKYNLDQSILKTKNLVFDHTQFPFYLKFSSIDFRFHKNVEFAYKLLPADLDWNPIINHEIQFLNLPAGNYTLLVNGFSRGVEWDQKPLEMALTILPPWWTTWWAYLLYIGLAVAFTYRFYRFQLSKKMALAESKRLKEVGQLKNSLYTNITHEFRTPLTIIKGMTESLRLGIINNKLEDAEKNLELIQRNSDGLMSLVNDMLDLSKLENGNMEMHRTQSNVISFIKYLTESFHSLAEECKIDFVIYAECEELIMDYDSNKLSIIVTNVLSNAIKFTPLHGKIVVHLNSILINEKKYFQIKIKDNGVGIAKGEIPNIFNRFYQGDNSYSRKKGGTGIGLALTKEFVELMGGIISVESELGKGSVFTIKIPVTNVAPIENEVELNPTDNVSILGIPNSLKSNLNIDSPLALIIEDNDDVAYYLEICLKERYETLHAKNGISGIEMAFTHVPDIIICDIMMPGKDGVEVCSHLKTNELTNHIPIVLLTAKATLKDRLFGLSHGADAYLTKPFVKEELLTRLDQLILLRKKLIQKFQNQGFSELSKSRTENPETKFLQKVIDVVHQDITDENFGSVELAQEIHISESQLYRKLKAITGKSSAVFIRSVRLQKAKELILSTDKTFSEISYDVGFKDPSWFSRTFKQEFGISPSEFKKKQQVN